MEKPWQERLLQFCGGKAWKPSRLTTLTMEEEEARVKAGWKSFDQLVWVAAFGEKEDLEKYVADADAWMEARRQGKIYLQFADQIPVWVKLKRGKQVYSESEVKKRKLRRPELQQLEEARRQLKKKLAEKAAEEAEEEKAAEEAKEGVPKGPLRCHHHQ